MPSNTRSPGWKLSDQIPWVRTIWWRSEHQVDIGHRLQTLDDAGLADHLDRRNQHLVHPK